MDTEATSHHPPRGTSNLWPKERRSELQALEEQLRTDYLKLELLELSGQTLSSAERTRRHQLISMARVCLSLSRFTRRRRPLREFLESLACESGAHATPPRLEVSEPLARELKLRWGAFGHPRTQRACPALDPDAASAGQLVKVRRDHDAAPERSAQ